ncbi:MAG TPA: hypothetical protein VI299_12125, partial [Polyangiales bacterium]
ASELGTPNSHAARALLHTSFAGRNSKRVLLMQFLDAVDRRDGASAARLFHPEGSWSTASSFGDIRGTDVQSFIETRLPPRQLGPHYARHHMESASDTEDLTVITPAGTRCRFELEVEELQQAGRSSKVIRRLIRQPER